MHLRQKPAVSRSAFPEDGIYIGPEGSGSMRLLQMGSTGPAVQLLQLALNRAAFGELETDGLFGGATRSALQRFQTAAGLVPDGVAGPLTHRALLPWYTGYLLHRIRPGETYGQLARRYGSGGLPLWGGRGERSDDFIVNASLSQPFLNGKLIARLEAFDLLHQLSDTHYEINAMGRTVTCYRSLPHYVMLHLVFHWSRQGK